MKTKSYTKSFQDKYNSFKVWNVTHTKCGHYYLSQSIKGRLFNKKVRVSLKFLKQILPDYY